MSPFTDWQAQNSFFNKEWKLKRVEQPFKEERRPKMRDRETRPIENSFGDEGLFARITFRMAISRSLRHINDRGDACFLSRQREIDGGLYKPGLYRVDKIRPIDPFHRRADGIDILEVAHHDFGSQLVQRRRSIVLAMHHGADRKPKRDRFFDGNPTRVSRCTRDQYFTFHVSLSVLNCSGASTCSRCSISIV